MDARTTALIIVDMQNDFLHDEGSLPCKAREHPGFGIDVPFLQSTIPYVSGLADGFRAVGRPVIYLAHVLKPDYSDAAFPYWRIGMDPKTWTRTHCVEGTWGADIVDELKPRAGEPVIVKKGFGEFREYITRCDLTQSWRDNLCRCGRYNMRVRLHHHTRRR